VAYTNPYTKHADYSPRIQALHLTTVRVKFLYVHISLSHAPRYRHRPNEPKTLNSDESKVYYKLLNSQNTVQEHDKYDTSLTRWSGFCQMQPSTYQRPLRQLLIVHILSQK